jgi:hypothetical protein
MANELTYTNQAATSLNLNDGTKYRLMRPPSGIYQPMGQPVLQDVPVTLPPVVYQGHVFRARTITVPLLVHGSSASDLITNVRALAAQFWSDMRGGYRGTLAYTSWNGNARSIRAVLDPSTDFDGWVAKASTGKGAVSIDLVFQCPDPTWYNATAVTPSGAFNGAVAVNISCANAGDCDSWPVITYTATGGTATVNPKVTDAYGRVWDIAATIAATKVAVLTFDPHAISIIYDGSTDWYGYETAASQFIRVKYGTNNLTFTATSGDATIGINFYSRYSTAG